MPFCGQCGFQLPPRVNHCPRCGAATEMNTSLEEAHPNDPTVALFPNARYISGSTKAASTMAYNVAHHTVDASTSRGAEVRFTT